MHRVSVKAANGVVGVVEDAKHHREGVAEEVLRRVDGGHANRYRMVVAEEVMKAGGHRRALINHPQNHNVF